MTTGQGPHRPSGPWNDGAQAHHPAPPSDPRGPAPQGSPQAQGGPQVPGPQPLQLAKVLLILFLVRILLFVVLEFGMEAVYWVLGATDVGGSLVYALIGLGMTGLSLLSSGVWVACLVLSIVVIVKARDRLRTGAIVLLATLVVPSLFGVDFSGDASGGVGVALSLVDLVFSLLTVVASAVGAYFLLRGYRAAAREDSSRHALF